MNRIVPATFFSKRINYLTVLLLPLLLLLLILALTPLSQTVAARSVPIFGAGPSLVGGSEFAIGPSATITESLVVPFSRGVTGVQTTQSYSGNITVTVSGVGQAAGWAWSDAFYIYDDGSQPIPPVHPDESYNWTLWIDNESAELLIGSVPAYNPAHVYTFQLQASGGPLVFAVGDIGIRDNTGQYLVTIETTTPTVPTARTMRSLYTASPPTVDGEFPDWPAVSGTFLGESTAKQIVGVRPSHADASTNMRSMWTADTLYLAVEVNDNRIISDSSQVWLDDAIEIGIDAAHDHTPGGADDHQFTVGANGRITDFGQPTTIFTASVRTRIDGWDAEIAIPSSILSGTLQTNMVLGLNFALIDDDDDGGVDSYLLWKAIAHGRRVRTGVSFSLWKSPYHNPRPSQPRHPLLQEQPSHSNKVNEVIRAQRTPTSTSGKATPISDHNRQL